LWPIYPQFLRDQFIRAFTTGIRNPGARVGESEWQQTLAQLRDCVFPCARCGQDNFGEPTANSRQMCLRCHAELPAPALLRLGDKAASPFVILHPSAKLYPHHLDPARRYDFSAPLAEISQNPLSPGQWGLKNLSASTWTFTSSDGTQRTASPGRSVPLVAGRQISFGRVQAEIQA